MPKEKYEPPNQQRRHTIMSNEDALAGKKSTWYELELTGSIRNLSPSLFDLAHLRVLYLNDNQLSRIQPEIARLSSLQYLDLSNNRLQSLPAEIGDMVELRELMLTNNHLRVLPYELGRLFQLQTLALKGNPLKPDILQLYNEVNGTQKLLQSMLDTLYGSIVQSHPPARPWNPLAHPERNKPTAIFSAMCYNILCDKYCTRQLYGYSPSWALNWEYRKKGIMEEIRHYSADIISLQEVETEQFHNFFLPELEQCGYQGIFAPKSRARTMSENDKRYVDGCAIFWKRNKFQLYKEQKIEFSHLAIANAEGSEDMLNRVMTKDNIGLVAVLETKEGIYDSGVRPDVHVPKHLLVATVHVVWDPEFCDVKLIQTLMLMSELKNIIENLQLNLRPGGSGKFDCSSMPMIFCGDLNSLPDSGVIEFLNAGKVSARHLEFKKYGYDMVLKTFSHTKDNDYLTHAFRLKQAYDEALMPYTNYTYDFKGIIDYIFYSEDHLNPLGVLGPIESSWFKENKVVGCPHPHIASDHFSLLVEFEMPILTGPQKSGGGASSGGNGPARR